MIKSDKYKQADIYKKINKIIDKGTERANLLVSEGKTMQEIKDDDIIKAINQRMEMLAPQATRVYNNTKE